MKKQPHFKFHMKYFCRSIFQNFVFYPLFTHFMTLKNHLFRVKQNHQKQEFSKILRFFLSPKKPTYQTSKDPSLKDKGVFEQLMNILKIQTGVIVNSDLCLFIIIHGGFFLCNFGCRQDIQIRSKALERYEKALQEQS